MKNILSAFLLLICIYLLGLPALAQEFPFVHYPSKTTGREGVLAVGQNQHKELVFVTREGVYSFNSRQTTKIFDFSKEKIAGVRQALFAGEELLILTEEELLTIDLAKGEQESLRKGFVAKVFYHSAKDLLYVSEGTLLKLLQENGETKVVLKEQEELQAIHFGENEVVVVGQRQLSTYSPDWELEGSQPLQKPVLDSYYLNDRLLLLTPDAIWMKEKGADMKKYQTVGREQLSCIFEDQSGKIWVGTKDKGLLLFDGNQRMSVNQKNNFPLSKVEGIYGSEDFSVWFYGKEGFAFYPFSAPFLKFEAGTHFSGKGVQDIKRTGQHQLTVLSGEGRLHRLKNGRLLLGKQISLPFEPAFSRLISEEQTIHISRQGDILFQNGESVFPYKLDSEVVQVFTFEEVSVLVSPAGNVYSFNHQTQSIRKNKWTLTTDKPLFQSGQSLIYTNSSGQLKKWDSENSSHQILANYSPEMAYTAIFDEKYPVFLSKDNQLSFIDGGRLRPLNFRLKEKEEVSGFFISGAYGWVSTGSHLYQLSFSQEGGTLQALEAKVFSAREYPLELPLIKSIEQEEGTFWLASANSLILYNSLALVPDITPPALVLEQILIKSQDSVRSIAFSRGDSIRLQLGPEEHLLVEAFVLEYGGSRRAAVKYKSSLSDNRWKEADQDNLILFTDLSTGRHILELAAISEQGVVSRAPVVLVVEKEQSFRFTWWVGLAASLSLMLLGYVAYSGIQSAKEGKSREARERYEKELSKLQRRSHEQMMKAEGLKQVNELISAQKVELEDKNKQIVAQKYELSLSNNQIKQQKDIIERTGEKLEASINYAQRIQTALMADEIQIKEDLPESFVFFKPRDQVSGDFFWFEKTSNQEGEEVLIVAAVDCTGHGVPGAIVSVVGIQLLNAIVHAKNITEPGKILTELNTDLLKSLKYEQTKINDGMDMSVCTINFQQKKLFFAGAKNPVYIVENGELEIIKGDRFPIGGQKFKEEKEYQTHEIALKGDGKQMFYLFSDGYQDQFGGDNSSKFLTRNFKNLLLEVHEKSMMEQKYLLAKTIHDWQGKESQTDDILVIGFRI